MTCNLPIKIAIAFAVGAIVSSSVVRADGNGDWDFSGYTRQSVDVAVATNRKTGHKMHVLRLKDGTIMAMVPATPLWDMMKDRALSDFGN